MIPVFLKETRALALWWLATGVLVLAFRSPEAARMPGTELLADGYADIGLVMGLFAFWIAQARVASEHTGDHLEFLDALPVSRLAVALAKVGACAAPVVCGWLGCSALRAWTVGSLPGLPMLEPASGLLTWAAFHGALLAGFFGLGCVGAWFGGLAWGALMTGLIIAAVLSDLTGVAFFDVIEGYWLIEWSAGAVVADWRGPAGALALALLGVCGGVVAFLGPGALLVRAGSTAARWLRWAAGFAGLFVAANIGFVSLAMLLLGLPVLTLDTETVRVDERFRVLLPRGNAEAVGLSAELVDLDARVAAVVGSDARIELDVELVGASPTEGGVYRGGKLRMRPEQGRETLAHELAHAHDDAISGDAMQELVDRIRFFLEGHAAWVAQQVVGSEEDHRAMLRHAAAIRATGQGELSVLMDTEAWIRDHDEGHMYPLGYGFVGALVEREGAESPACLLRALGERADELEDAAGLALWHVVAADCAVDLDAVVAAWLDGLAEVELPELPELETASEPGGWRVTDRRSTGAALACRFRDDVDEEQGKHAVVAVEDGRCARPGSVEGNPAYDVQFGFELDGARRVWLPWRKISEADR